MINNYYNHLNLNIFAMPPRMNFGNNDQYHLYENADSALDTDSESEGSYTDDEEDEADEFVIAVMFITKSICCCCC